LRAVGYVLALGLLGCQAKPERDPLVERAAFGVFFGGQIQDRKELAFELDRAKQSCGIRLDFREPLTHSARVSWEIARPLSEKASKGDAGADRVEASGITESVAGDESNKSFVSGDEGIGADCQDRRNRKPKIIGRR